MERVVEDVVDTLADHRRPPRQGFVENRTETVYVGTVVDVVVHPDLLRRHVRHRPLKSAVKRQREVVDHRLGGCRRRPRTTLRIPDLGETPVEQKHLPERTDENVLRFHVAVRDTVAVRVFQGVGHLDDDFD